MESNLIPNQTNPPEHDGGTSCILQGIPVENEHNTWPNVMFKVPRVEPPPGIGISLLGNKRKAELWSSSAGPSSLQPIKGASRRVSEFVHFGLEPTDMSSCAIRILYNEEKDRALAEFVRDLQVVTRHHIQRLMEVRGLYPCSTIKDLASLSPPENPIKRLKEVGDLIRSSCTILRDTMKANSSNRKQRMGKRKLLDARPVIFGPFPEPKSDIMISKMAFLYLKTRMPNDKEDIHYADYALNDHGGFDGEEPFFNDGNGLVLIRDDMRSLNWACQLGRKIVDSYASCCNAAWTAVGNTSKVVFYVIEEMETRLDKKCEVLNQMFTWILKSVVDITQASAILIPLLVDNHYLVMVIDFNRDETLIFDSVMGGNKDKWFRFAKFVLSCFHCVLHQCGDERKNVVLHKPVRMIHPPWCNPFPDADSGVAATHVFGCYTSSEGSLKTKRLNEESVMMDRRLALCATIMKSPNNLHRLDIAHSVDRFVWAKEFKHIKPSALMLKSLGILATFPNKQG